MKFIKKILFTITLMLVGFLNINAQNLFLWEVHKEESKFYLFGTMHLPDPQLQTLPLQLKNIIVSSDEIRTEIPMDLENQLEIIPLMMRNDKLTLKDILSQKLYTKTEQYLQTINPMLTLKAFDNMQIWAISTLLSVLKIQMQHPNLKVIDEQIYHEAQNQHKGVGGIETVNEQINLFKPFSTKEQIIMLESTLAYLEKNKNFVEELKALYLSGNGKKIITFIESTMFKIEKYKKFEKKMMQTLLYNRNEKMTKRIEDFLRSSPKKQYLFAFGVMHFLGEKSIIEKLRDKGYKVMRVKSQSI